MYSQSSWTPTLRNDCGAATVTNTDVIEVVGQRDDVHNKLTIDNVFEHESPEPADRRSTDSSFAGSGIEFRIAFGLQSDGTPDEFELKGSGLADLTTVGTNGITLDNVGTKIVFTGGVFPALRVEGGFGNDVLSAAGSPETGASPTAGVDFDAESGRDIIIGGAGGDTLRGGIGNDEVDGGPGSTTSTATTTTTSCARTTALPTR